MTTKIDLSPNKDNHAKISAHVERILGLKSIKDITDPNSAFVKVSFYQGSWTVTHWLEKKRPNEPSKAKGYLIVRDYRFSTSIALQEIPLNME